MLVHLVDKGIEHIIIIDCLVNKFSIQLTSDTCTLTALIELVIIENVLSIIGMSWMCLDTCV